MKRLPLFLGALAALSGPVIYVALADDHRVPDIEAILANASPPGYRDWRVISVAHEEGNHDDLRAVLGNDVAIRAYRDGTVPFPDGTVIARLAWRHVPSERNNRAFGRLQSFVAGPATNVQFMAKDAVKFAATGGWRFAQFEDGRPAPAPVLHTCFPCHDAFKAGDLVFTHYAP